MFEEIRITLPMVSTYHQAWVHLEEEWLAVAAVEVAINRCHIKVTNITINKINMARHTDKTHLTEVLQLSHAEGQSVCKSISISNTHSLLQT